VPKKSDPLAGLSPLVQQIASLVGRRADDAELVAFVTKTLGQKVPAATTDAAGTKYVLAKKHGVELLFGHDIKNEKYPLVAKTAKSFIPYLQLAWMTKKFKELPYGIAFGMAPEEVTKRFGAEPETVPIGLKWARVLDADRDIKLDYDGRECRIVVNQAGELSGRHGVPAKSVVGVFVAWAAQRGLLDASRAGAHTSLLEDVRAEKRKGSELLDAAWPRGLWDVHLADKPGLRQFAYRWFHRLGDVGYIRDDLVAVFGGRENRYGHQEPVIDDDDAAAVKKATPKLDAVFAPWLG
jgi:hypothetical protein